MLNMRCLEISGRCTSENKELKIDYHISSILIQSLDLEMFTKAHIFVWAEKGRRTCRYQEVPHPVQYWLHQVGSAGTLAPIIPRLTCRTGLLSKVWNFPSTLRLFNTDFQFSLLRCVSSIISPRRFPYFYNYKSILYYLKLAMEYHGHKFYRCSGNAIACADLKILLNGNMGVILGS